MVTRIYFYFLLSLCVVVFASPVLAQGSNNVTGKVLIKGERKPIEGVAVFVVGHEEVSPAVTDEKGLFSIELPDSGEYSLIAIMVGFAKPEPVKVSARPGYVTVSIYLDPISKMNEIVVDAERNPNRAGKTVISGKELYDMPGASGDPVKAILALPGITTGQGGAGGSPAIRGSSSEDNIYYIDFIPAGYIFHFGGIYSVIHHDLVDDFNLYLSSAPAEFESSLGGVIDVNLREPRSDRWGVKASMSMYESDILLEGSSGGESIVPFYSPTKLLRLLC